MANYIADPSNVTLAEIIAAINECTAFKAEEKLKVIMKVSTDATQIPQVAIVLNNYMADKEEEKAWTDGSSTYARAELNQKKKEARKIAEEQKKEREAQLKNMAAKAIMARGKINYGTPEFEKAVKDEIKRLSTAENIYSMDTGDCFTYDSSMSNLTEEQKALVEKKMIDDSKSNVMICNDDKRPMNNGEHYVVISYYAEKRGHEGKHDYAVVQVMEEKTGKRVWLPSWCLAKRNEVAYDERWTTREQKLKDIAWNNDGMGEGMNEDDFVEHLQKFPFKVWTYYNPAKDRTMVYLDKAAYVKYVQRIGVAMEKSEDMAKREAALRAQGFDPDKWEGDESMTGKEYKF